MACMAFPGLSSTYQFKPIHPTSWHTLSIWAKLKGQAIPHFFAFGHTHIFIWPSIFLLKHTYGNSYPSFRMNIHPVAMYPPLRMKKGIPSTDLIPPFPWLPCPYCIPLSLYMCVNTGNHLEQCVAYRIHSINVRWILQLSVYVCIYL